jgi:hypothetical protein
LILAKTYICNENPEKNTGIFRCFFGSAKKKI